MGTLFSTLDIARSGLQAAQIQIDIAGHNIANVNKESYSRQRAELISRYPNFRPYGTLGRGVQVGAIERIHDNFLDVAFRTQVSGLGDATVRSQYLTRVEDIFLEPGEQGFGTRLGFFFDALSDFSNHVESYATRRAVLSEAQALSGVLNAAAERFYVMRTDANEEVRALVSEVNSLTERIALLNVSIRRIDAGERSANDFRDDRDGLLDELAQLINITTRERSNGEMDVLIAGDMLVEGSQQRLLEAYRNPALDPERGDLVEVRFAANSRIPDIRDGEIYSALDLRDNVLTKYDQRLDTIAAAIIKEINDIHGDANGLDGISGTITSSNSAVDGTTVLNAAGLPFTVTAGSFSIVVYDAVGAVAGTLNIAVDPTTDTVITLRDKINTAAGVAGVGLSAVESSGALQLTVASPETFVFDNDTSGLLTAMGLNGLFTGYDARTMGVNADILANPRLLSSAYSIDPLDTGDNTAALAMADVRNLKILDSGASTIDNFYEVMLVDLGIETRAALDMLEVEQAFVTNFQQRRQEVSGVSIDEEVTFMMQYQRAYEASARVVTVTDRMLDALMAMAR